ncbi:MAG: hypothetical protein HY461_01270 [Parcubacteria group bacterium]|nr:hypothetical protein [Parcubacteria group bacterium]
MDKHLASLLELIKKTGDRLVVFDASSEAEPFVIMDLPSYENLRFGQAAEENRPFIEAPQTESIASQPLEGEASGTDKYYFEEIDEETAVPDLPVGRETAGLTDFPN